MGSSGWVVGVGVSVCVLVTSVKSDSATPWTVACQAPLSMEFSRQEYWSGLPCPAPGDLPNLGTEPRSPALQVDSLPFEPPGKPQQRGWGAFYFVDMDT